MMKENRLHTKEQGVILLLMMIALVSIALGTMLTALNPNNFHLSRQKQTMHELSLAKDKFLAYAASADIYSVHADVGPGHLVCPDTNNNGQPESNCSSGALGRLPLQFPLLSGSGIYSFDAPSESNVGQFWYALTGDFRDASTRAVNTTTTGILSIGGESDIVAIIIAPGDALEGQSRHNNNPVNYLEGSNLTGPDFTRGIYGSTVINDMIVSISRQELMTLVTPRIAGIIKAQLDIIHPNNANKYPTQVEFESLSVGSWPTWFSANDWQLSATTSYNLVSDDIVEVRFNNCNMVFTIDINLPTITTKSAMPGGRLGC